MSLYNRLLKLDRRIIFLLIAISIIIPILFKVTFPEYPTKMSIDAYEAIESLPDGSHILFSLDFDPAASPELEPMTHAILRQLLTKNVKITMMTLMAQGAQM